jgi:response regulator RpfG family c-di-GMP phosphodiesterase
VGPLTLLTGQISLVCSGCQAISLVFPNNRNLIAMISLIRTNRYGIKLNPQHKTSDIFLLISNNQTRNYLRNLLVENHYSPLLIADQEELWRVLKDNQCAVVLIDCGAVNVFGARTISKIKVVCPQGRIIILCDKAHLCDSQHRDFIKEILNIGVYACILAPYKEWEVLSLVAYYSRLAKK